MSSIVFVDRGNCHFVKKVENLQRIGARIAVVVDNKDEFQSVVMANDGNGNKVLIPSFFISMKDGEIIKNYLIANPEDKVYF